MIKLSKVKIGQKVYTVGNGKEIQEWVITQVLIAKSNYGNEPEDISYKASCDGKDNQYIYDFFFKESDAIQKVIKTYQELKEKEEHIRKENLEELQNKIEFLRERLSDV